MKKTYTSREFKRLLMDNGYTYKRCNGDHMTYNKGNDSVTFNTVKLNRMVARRLIKEHHLRENT